MTGPSGGPGLTVAVSCQHSENVTLEELRKDIMKKVVLRSDLHPREGGVRQTCLEI